MFFTIDLSEFTPSGAALNHFLPAFGTSSSLLSRPVFEHLWLAFSDISCVFTSSCFCLVLGGKLHVTKPVSISFSALNLPSKDLVALFQASCRNRYSCSSELYSEVLVAFYFRAHLPGRIPLFLHLLVRRHYWACFPFLWP